MFFSNLGALSLKVRLMQKETETNNQNAEMLTAVMFPVVSVNSRPTQPALGVLYVCAPAATHM